MEKRNGRGKEWRNKWRIGIKKIKRMNWSNERKEIFFLSIFSVDFLDLIIFFILIFYHHEPVWQQLASTFMSQTIICLLQSWCWCSCWYCFYCDSLWCLCCDFAFSWLVSAQIWRKENKIKCDTWFSMIFTSNHRKCDTWFYLESYNPLTIFYLESYNPLTTFFC